jgi:DNA (cytosine-5)-methyltransferase 1
MLTSVEICAGAGGQALGLERAGFEHLLVAEIDRDAAATLRLNRPAWNVFEGDIRDLNGRDFRGVDLLAGGVPCPPFSFAGQQLGPSDERDLFPEALRLVEESQPKAVLLENVRGLASARFSTYRQSILARLDSLGYRASWQVIYSSEHGVAQLRPRFLLVAIRGQQFDNFGWPAPVGSPPTVGNELRGLMGARSWRGAAAWADRAQAIGPTIVGGSKKHGGADLGPTRAKSSWALLGVDGRGVSDQAPGPDASIDHVPRLTLEMVARLQGFDSSWSFAGKKTSAYRQIGNAFPPPVAKAVGHQIAMALSGKRGGLSEEQLQSARRVAQPTAAGLAALTLRNAERVR